MGELNTEKIALFKRTETVGRDRLKQTIQLRELSHQAQLHNAVQTCKYIPVHHENPLIVLKVKTQSHVQTVCPKGIYWSHKTNTLLSDPACCQNDCGMGWVCFTV